MPCAVTSTYHQDKRNINCEITSLWRGGGGVLAATAGARCATEGRCSMEGRGGVSAVEARRRQGGGVRWSTVGARWSTVGTRWSTGGVAGRAAARDGRRRAQRGSIDACRPGLFILGQDCAEMTALRSLFRHNRAQVCRKARMGGPALCPLPRRAALPGPARCRSPLRARWARRCSRAS